MVKRRRPVTASPAAARRRGPAGGDVRAVASPTMPESTPPDRERHLIRYSGRGGFSPGIVDRASGSTVFTEDGRELLDFTSGQMSAILGHCHPEIVATVREQVGRLDHLYSGMLSRPVLDLARRLAETLPDAAGEGDAADHRRRVQRGRAADGQARHRPPRDRLVRPVLARHDPAPRRTPPTSPDATGTGRPRPATSPCRCPTGSGPTSSTPTASWTGAASSTSGFDLIDAQSVGSLAACLVEPILSSGGVVDLPPGYLAALRDKCHERGMLLIVDEAQTGPVPHRRLVRVRTRRRRPRHPHAVQDPRRRAAAGGRAHQRGDRAGGPRRGYLFFTTHVNDPLPAAVGNTVLDVLIRDRLDERARELGDRLHGGLLELAGAARGDRRRPRARPAGGARAGGRPRMRRTPTRSARAVTRRCAELGLHMNIVQLPGHGRHLPDRPAAHGLRRRDRPRGRDPRRGPDRRDELISAGRRRPRPASASPRPPARRRSSAT